MKNYGSAYKEIHFLLEISVCMNGNDMVYKKNMWHNLCGMIWILSLTALRAFRQQRRKNSYSRSCLEKTRVLPAFSGGWEEMPTETSFFLCLGAVRAHYWTFITWLSCQHNTDRTMVVQSIAGGRRGGGVVTKASEESLPLAGRRCIRGEYPTPDGSGW